MPALIRINPESSRRIGLFTVAVGIGVDVLLQDPKIAVAGR
jgi:hypothetical protein